MNEKELRKKITIEIIETLEKMQLRKPDLTTVIVRIRGHVPYLDEPEAIDAIETFLDEN